MFYNASEVARYIISTCYIKNNPVKNLKLQKLLYFSWIDFYKTTYRSLFIDDICAWQLGPVVPEVYYEFCSYGGRPICFICNTSISEGADSTLLDRIIDQYLPFPASVLVERSHRHGGAWDYIFKNGAGNRNIIPYELIKRLDC